MHSYTQRQKNLRPSLTLKCTFCPSSLLVERPFQWGSFSFCLPDRLWRFYSFLIYTGFLFCFKRCGIKRLKVMVLTFLNWLRARADTWRQLFFVVAFTIKRLLYLVTVAYLASGWRAGVERAWSSSLSLTNTLTHSWIHEKNLNTRVHLGSTALRGWLELVGGSETLFSTCWLLPSLRRTQHRFLPTLLPRFSLQPLCMGRDCLLPEFDALTYSFWCFSGNSDVLDMR